MNQNAQLVKETSRSYRGATEITLSWTENNEQHQKDFDDVKEAKAFKESLIKRLQAQEAEKEIASAAYDAVHERLQAMQIELSDAVCIIEQLMLLAPEGYEHWVESIKKQSEISQQCEEAGIEDLVTTLKEYTEFKKGNDSDISRILENHKRVEFLDNMLNPDELVLEEVVEDYAANRIADVPMKEMAQVYERYCMAKLESIEIFNSYKEALSKSESDEDERMYIISKLKKLINKFDGDIVNTTIEQAREWIIEQPGSGSAKERMTEIVEDFYEFITEKDSKIIKSTFVA